MLMLIRDYTAMLMLFHDQSKMPRKRKLSYDDDHVCTRSYDDAHVITGSYDDAHVIIGSYIDAHVIT